MGAAVGIDLGTTNSVVAHVGAGGRPAVLPNRFGQATTPSVVAFRHGEVVVGQEARALMAAGEPQVAAFFKRRIGSPHFVFHAGGGDRSAVELQTLLLGALKADAARALGREVTHAVITVPAYFKHPEREATLAAGRGAGLSVLQVVNEPTAAAIAYGGRAGSRREVLLVYDLGGGTFDVTLLALQEDELRVLTSDGDHELGGKDWDDRIVEYLAGRFAAEFGVDPLEDMESAAELLVRAEETKKSLSSVDSTVISLVHGGRRGRYEIDRPTFERITADLLARTEALTAKVLDDQGLAASQIDGVLLVGGSTRMPAVGDLVRRFFGQAPRHGIHPDEAVALGAALVAAELHPEVALGAPGPRLGGGVRTVDVTNHSLGLIARNEDGTAYVNSLILPKNTPIPCRQVRPYRHQVPAGRSASLEVFMTQGESALPADATYLGKYVLHEVPAPPGGGATVVDVEYAYDLNGTVQVKGMVRHSGEALAMSVEPLPPDVPARFLVPPKAGSDAVHVTAYLAFDLSGSMTGEPLAAARRAALGFLENTDLAHCSLGIIAFADTVAVKLEACQDARRIERAIASLAIGETGYGNAAHPFAAARRLLARAAPPKFVITLADGVWSCQEEAVAAAGACRNDGAESIAIGFGGADLAFLQRIASSEEASFFTSLQGLADTFSSIAQVITETQTTARASVGGKLAPPSGSSARGIGQRV